MKAFISAYKPVCGYKSVWFWLNENDHPHIKFWEPYDVSKGVFGTMKEAETYAKGWALEQNIKYISNKEARELKICSATFEDW